MSKLPPLFYVIGEMTRRDGGEPALWTASCISDLMGALLDDPGYPSLDTVAQLAVRHAFACAAAIQMREGLLTAALAAGTFSWAGASDRELDRLNAAPDADSGAPWSNSAVPLVLVRPPDPDWAPPPRHALVLDPRTTPRLMLGLKAGGWLDAVGRLDG